jgi:hypothetical protein
MKRLFVFLLVFVFLAACVPTPEEEFVTHKDTETMLDSVETVEEPQKSIAVAVGAPETLHITKECDSARMEVSVSIDADVVLPDTSKMPMAHIRRGSFSEEFLRRVMHVLGNDSKPIEVFPKSYYQDIAKGLMEQRDSGDLDKYDSVEEINKEIIDVLAEADASPDEPVYSDRDPATEADIMVDNEGNPVQSGLIRDSEWWSSSWCGLSEIGTVYHIFCESRSIKYCRNIHEVTAFENAYNFKNPLEFAKPMIDKGMIRMTVPERSIEDAQKEAQRVVTELGLADDFTLTHARLAPLMEYAQEAQENGCKAIYEFLFTRQINGVNVTYTNDLYSNGSYGEEQEDVFAPEWRYERVRVYVDDQGLFAFYYDSSPYEITEITENVRVMTLDDAIAAFEQRLGFVYADTLNRVEKKDASIRITEIRLGLTRVLEQNADGQAYLVPGWTFFGVKQLYDNKYISGWEGEGYDGTTAILTINAIDGSVIDRNKGY